MERVDLLMKVLYYDCFYGISGDMNLGAMLDLGVDGNYLIEELKKLKLQGYEISISKDERKGICGTKVEVNLERHYHHQIQGHEHENHHEYRNLRDIEAIINNSDLSDRVKKLSLNIFSKVAEAEAKVHGKAVQELEFYETIAVDSIVYIVGAAICFDFLKVDKVLCSTVELGGDFLKCGHGFIPVPAPAVLEILKEVPVSVGAVKAETTTEVGAAILKALTSEFTDSKKFIIKKTAYGIGHEDTEIPSVLRLILAEKNEEAYDIEKEEASVIECNIDDMSPETYGYVMDKLFEAGADDVYITPIIMKKGRPANKLSVLCKSNKISKIEEIIFKETSSLGCRSYKVNKAMLKREFVKVKTRFGEITVKNAYLKGKKIKSKPEYDEVRKAAEANKVGINEVYKEIYKEI